MDHHVHGTIATKELLDTFEGARRRKANPEQFFVTRKN